MDISQISALPHPAAPGDEKSCSLSTKVLSFEFVFDLQVNSPSCSSGTRSAARELNKAVYKYIPALHTQYKQDSVKEKARSKAILTQTQGQRRYLINDELVLEENMDLGIAGSPSFIGLNSVGISKPLVA